MDLVLWIKPKCGQGGGGLKPKKFEGVGCKWPLSSEQLIPSCFRTMTRGRVTVVLSQDARKPTNRPPMMTSLLSPAPLLTCLGGSGGEGKRGDECSIIQDLILTGQGRQACTWCPGLVDKILSSKGWRKIPRYQEPTKTPAICQKDSNMLKLGYNRHFSTSFANG